MSKPEPLKSVVAEAQIDTKTKSKLVPLKAKANQKSTVPSHSRALKQNEYVTKLISQSAMVSQESSIEAHGESSDSVVQIDELCVNGTIQNLHELTEEVKAKYKVTNGVVFDIDQFRVIFAGRHQVPFRNGLLVALYVPPAYKSARDPITKKIQVLIERKIKQITDPMQFPYVIIDPTNSLYPTYICTWVQCKRKLALEHYIQYNQETTMAFTLGNAIHCYLQWLIRKQVEVQPPGEKEMRKLYEHFLYDMFLIELHFQVFVELTEDGIINLVQWYRKYVVQGSIIELNKWEKKYLKITRVLGSEVMIKSQYFGIRGKVDGLFEGQYHDQKANLKQNVVIPFELKTGKKVLDSHKRQIDFYNLLLRQNRLMPSIGLLYYSEFNTLQYRMENQLVCFENINAHRNKIILNIINLFQNGLSIRLPGLPETFDQCKLCDVVIQCAVNRMEPNKLKDLEDITEQVPEKYNKEILQKIKKLSILQMAYLKKWTQLLHLQQYIQKSHNRKNKIKQYYSNIKLPLIQVMKFTEHSPGQNINLTLIKQIQSHEMSEELDSYFRIGQKLRIFIPLIRLADGCRIVNTSKNTKKFQMQIQIRNEGVKFNKTKCGFLLQDQQVKQIDVQMEKYDNSFYNYARGYCYKFVAEAEAWLKQIVIDESYEPAGEQPAMEKQVEQTKQLNDDQRLAFKKCVQMDRFCLVEGMPGTGKTQLILKLVQYYYRIGKTVLVTSFTNQALSNILDREMNEQKKIPIDHIIREGSKFGIAQEYEHLSSQSQQHRSIQEYKIYFSLKKVWFVTISSLYIQHLPKKFDVVIIDEASQCLQANCLEALLKAQKFVLIGDERQLQPVVKSKEAIQRGMQISLFERLCNLYPNMKATLKKQYRMSPAIMNLTNNLVYDGKLELAKEQMKQRMLKIPKQWRETTPLFLHNVVDPQKSLRFINYDNALNLFTEGDTIDLRRLKRLLQIRIACCLYKQFRELGIKKQDILIISAYNSLVHQLVAALIKQKLIETNNSDVLTIDKSQGTDKQIIIFIFHKGNKDLIENYRRLNVALTRAKNKFIIVGSHKQLSQLATWTGRLAKLLIPDQIDIQKQFLEALLNQNTI